MTLETKLVQPDLVVLTSNNIVQGEVWFLETRGGFGQGFRRITEGTLTLFDAPDYFEPEPMQQLTLAACLELGAGRPYSLHTSDPMPITALDRERRKYLFLQMGFRVYWL